MLSYLSTLFVGAARFIFDCDELFLDILEFFLPLIQLTIQPLVFRPQIGKLEWKIRRSRLK